MISRPLAYSVPTGSDKEILNSLNYSFSQSILEEILSNDDNRIQTFEKCPTCKAVLNFKMVSIDSSSRYACVFCKTPIEIKKPLMKELSMMDGDQSYFLDMKKAAHKAKASTNVMIMICLDYSTSMNVSYNSPNTALAQSYLQKKEKQDFLSRKELLLINLEKQLTLLFDSSNKYNYQIFVITFDKEILMYGQGTHKGNPIALSPDLFSSLEKCVDFGKENASKLFDKNKNSDLPYLFEKLHAKEPEGFTALGPAVACGLGVIEALKPEMSQFYIFTDGMANHGFGAMKGGKEEPESMDIEAKKAYLELGKKGVELGTVFHIIGYEDEQSKLKILNGLITSNRSQLEKIRTPVAKVKIVNNKEIKEYTYDEKQLNDLLKTSLSVSAETYGILVKLRVYSAKEINLKFCRECENDVTKKKTGPTSVFKKRSAAISDKIENVSFKYQVDDVKSSIFLQFQLDFTRPTTGEKTFIVTNFSSDFKPFSEYQDVDLIVCNIIMMNDTFQHNENLCKNYLVMMYLCKHFSQQKKKVHQTFAEAEEVMKKYIQERYKEKSSNLFEEAEEAAKKIVNEKTEDETIKKRKYEKKKIDASSDENDSDTIDSRKHKLFIEEEMSIKLRGKKLKGSSMNNPVEKSKKKEEESKKESDTINNKKYITNIEKEQESMKKAGEKKKFAKDYADSDSDDNKKKNDKKKKESIGKKKNEDSDEDADLYTAHKQPIENPNQSPESKAKCLQLLKGKNSSDEEQNEDETIVGRKFGKKDNEEETIVARQVYKKK